MKIEAGKFYRTRDGRRARVYAVNCGGRFPIHGAIEDEFGWFMADWTAKGRQAPFTDPLYNSPADIVADWKESKPKSTKQPKKP